MEKRILLKDIPSSKFHSAIFTTYSINLYYLEQQVIPLMTSKGIHYISILADSSMLSNQLSEFSRFSQPSKRNYSIHGIQSNGSFHPKIIFIAGTNSVLILVGSGNLTTCGHGKNLEVWTPVYIESRDDSRLGFVIQCWNYLKKLHSGIGESSLKKLSSIEENCDLLSSEKNDSITSLYSIDKNSSIGFMCDDENKSLMSQLLEITGKSPINEITIMTPYYDKEGKFIEEMNRKYKPDRINVILQKHFGSAPIEVRKSKNIKFYDWNDIRTSDTHEFFHAKNILLEGERGSFLLCGSSNASIAAFGTKNSPGANQEACVVFGSRLKNLKTLLDIQFNMQSINLEEFKNSEILPNQNQSKFSLFIKSAERSYNIIKLNIRCRKRNKEETTICFYGNYGFFTSFKIKHFELGDTILDFKMSNNIPVIYTVIKEGDKSISNNQFVIDIRAFERTNPSPKNRELNNIRRMLESGKFSTINIINYLSTVHNQQSLKKKDFPANLDSKSSKPSRADEEESDLLYMPYNLIQEKASHIVFKKRPSMYIEYKGVRLWESIILYLKEHKEKAQQLKFDEEESDDPDRSRGRKTTGNDTKPPISELSFERFKIKVLSFLDNYDDFLDSKIKEPACEQPNLIDLSMYLIIMEVLLHLLTHIELIEKKERPQRILPIAFNLLEYSWSEYMLQFIAKFTLWCNQKKGFIKIEYQEYQNKVELYKNLAFMTSINGLCLIEINNVKSKKFKIEKWIRLNYLNAQIAFEPNQCNNPDEYIKLLHDDLVEEYGLGIIKDKIANILSNMKLFRNSNQIEVGSIIQTESDGYMLIEKIIPNNYLKLCNPAFEWNNDLKDYWNGYIYSLETGQWKKSVRTINEKKSAY